MLSPPAVSASASAGEPGKPASKPASKAPEADGKALKGDELTMDKKGLAAARSEKKAATLEAIRAKALADSQKGKQ